MEIDSVQVEEEELASPVRDEWPADSLLSKEHFTIDEQPCLSCSKKLGYAMPMNKLPKGKYLFCDPLEKPSCTASTFVPCTYCGNLQNYKTEQGYLVFRPGNCAYTTPTQIYAFMCSYCFTDMMRDVPPIEQTREQYKAFRALREAGENSDAAAAATALSVSSNLSILKSQDVLGENPKKRKRIVAPPPSCEYE